MLHTAIRVRQGRMSGVLSDQLLSTFVQVYRKAMNSEDRLRLFQLLCQDFGVQGKWRYLPRPVCSRCNSHEKTRLSLICLCMCTAGQCSACSCNKRKGADCSTCVGAGADVDKAIDSWKQAASKCYRLADDACNLCIVLLFEGCTPSVFKPS